MVTVDVPPARIGTCPVCGRDADDTTAVQLPEGLAGVGAHCVTAVERGTHYHPGVHPDFRPDAVLVHHDTPTLEG